MFVGLPARSDQIVLTIETKQSSLSRCQDLRNPSYLLFTQCPCSLLLLREKCFEIRFMQILLLSN